MVGYCWRFGGGVFFFPHVLGKEAQNLARRAACKGKDQSEAHATTTCILDFSLHFFGVFDPTAYFQDHTALT